jgi:Ser/Thr protein kinase RdoA (MazF antagonist)
VVGRYRLLAGNQAFFARITSRIGDPELEAEVTEHLTKRQLGISQLLLFDSFDWRGKRYRLDIHPFFNGRHFNGGAQDLYHISESLGRLHRCLEEFEEKGQVRAVAEKRYLQLAQAVEAITDAVKKDSFAIFENAEDWMKGHAEWLEKMSHSFNPFLHLLPDAQCLHGEVHPGNVLLSAQDDRVIWVDFEESIHTYTSPSWDLAFLVQRFCLSDDPCPETVHECLETIQSGYHGKMINLAWMMRQAAWFSMAVLVDQTIRGHIVSPLSEYDKFERLERQADRYEDVLKEHEKASFFRP